MPEVQAQVDERQLMGQQRPGMHQVSDQCVPTQTGNLTFNHPTAWMPGLPSKGDQALFQHAGQVRVHAQPVQPSVRVQRPLRSVLYGVNV